MLRLQEFIELCRRRDTVGAIAYARKNLANWAVSHMFELQQAMTLLAFGEKTGVGVYRVSLDDSRTRSQLMTMTETIRPVTLEARSRSITGDLPGPLLPPQPASAISRALCWSFVASPAILRETHRSERRAQITFYPSHTGSTALAQL